MTVCELAEKLNLKSLSVPDESREMGGVYIGDLLSWVMGRASADDVWITIMSNINVVAVASLADVACIILAEGVVPEEDVLRTAEAKDVNIYSSSLTAFQLAQAISHFEA